MQSNGPALSSHHGMEIQNLLTHYGGMSRGHTHTRTRTPCSSQHRPVNTEQGRERNINFTMWNARLKRVPIQQNNIYHKTHINFTSNRPTICARHSHTHTHTIHISFTSHVPQPTENIPKIESNVCAPDTFVYFTLRLHITLVFFNISVSAMCRVLCAACAPRRHIAICANGDVEKWISKVKRNSFTGTK